MNVSGTRKNWSKPGAETETGRGDSHPVGDVQLGRLLHETEHLVVLDDASGAGPSYLFRNPLEILRAHAPSEITELMERLDQARNEGLHVAGYMNYEAGDFADGTSPTNASRPDTSGPDASQPHAQRPLAWFGLFRERETLDHSRAWSRPYGTGSASRAFSLRESPGYSDPEHRRRFHRDLKRIRERLARGDVYQINYTLETELDFQGDPAALYGALRRHQPAAYGAFIKTGDTCILSLSPELFFRARMQPDGRALLETRPIKGTVARGMPPGGAKDRALRDSLSRDEKTRAENLMITDLLRNDLGRHALPGSVRVPELFAVESLPQLHQMYSVIQGELPAEKTARLFRDVFPALFPCGSITGAPKIAARKIIRELEGRERGVYTGALGCASPDQVVFNVAIRTLEIRVPDKAREESRDEGRNSPMPARLGVGCGIVWDSKPEDEWRELLLKKSFVTPALDDFRVIETMLLSEGKIYFAREHALRLGRTLRRFHIPRNYRRLRAALEEAVRTNQQGHFRLRMTVDRSGHYEIALTQFERGLNALGTRTMNSPHERPEEFRLLLSRERIWSGNPFRRWKTTERHLYDRAFALARKEGFQDVLFLNEKLEVAETCIGNILLYDRKTGWATPTRNSGALPGTLLAYLENRHPGRIRRRAIGLRELRAARFVFVVNSVRGLRRVTSLQAPGKADS